MSGQGAGRRLTADEERRGAELFAQGRSTRAVARELGCGNATASRLRQRLADAGRLAVTEEEHVSDSDDGQGQELTDLVAHEPGRGAGTPVLMMQTDASAGAVPVADTPDLDAELVRLRARHEELTAEAAMYAERAQASTQAVAALEAERLQLLASGHDAQQLRTRRRDAEDDLRDSTDAAQIAQGALGVIAGQIAAVEARQAERQLRAELAGAVAERDQVLATIGDRQRAAVLAVRQAAEEFTQTFADEQRVITRVDQLAAQIALGGPAPVVPPPVTAGLSVPGDAAARQPLALLRAVHQARNGNVAAVSEQLGIADGWLPADPPSAAELAAIQAHYQRLMHQRPGMPAGQVLPYESVASVGIDAAGRPIPPGWEPVPPQERVPAHVHPYAHPLDSYRAPGSYQWPPYTPQPPG